MQTSPRVPESTAARLPVYLRVLSDLAGVESISSDELATACGITSAQLRKDLSFIGTRGTRGVGYDVRHLRDALAAELGMQHDWPVVVVGGGNLGLALAAYAGFASRGFRVVGLVDADRLRVGEPVGEDLVVQPMSDLAKIVRRTHCVIGLIATPAQAAQAVADELVEAGVTGILNFAPTVLSVPVGVRVRDVDLGVELQLLAFHEQQRTLAGNGMGVGE
jgi:redox-sensing transcriptional repressor